MVCVGAATWVISGLAAPLQARSFIALCAASTLLFGYTKVLNCIVGGAANPDLPILKAAHGCFD